MSSMDLAPYGDHMEHLRDLVNLFLPAKEECNSAEREEAVLRIKERAGQTGIFLPVEYLVHIFRLDETGRRFIYTLAAKAFLEAEEGTGEVKGSLNIDYYISDPGSKAAVRKYLLENKDIGKEPGFNQRIKRFIFSPFDNIDRYWIQFYTAGESKIVPFKNTYEALKNLTLFLLDPKDIKNRMLWLYGKPGSGRKAHIKLLCDELKLSLMFFDMDKIAELDNPELIIEEIILESLLTGCFICFDNIDKFFENTKPYVSKFFFDSIKCLPRLYFAAAQTEPKGLNREDYRIGTIRIPPPNYEESVRLWSHFSKNRSIEEGFDIHSAASMFLLLPIQIKNCIEDAENLSISLGKDVIPEKYILEGCRKYSAPRLSGMGRLIEPIFKWEDLVLPKRQRILLESALNRAKYKKKVYSDWNFESKAPYGRGLAILLSGPSGTGKTMAAQVFAGELKLSLFKIDLPMIVSKYIGETEKNLKEIFDEANAGNYVLFFDEADSLFGKRTEIKNSHDRNANMEVSYLLQRLEEYEGITILATNIIKNFDEAFKRRFQFIIDFPLPDAEGRQRMWEKVFPKELPLDSDIDYEYLAEFPLTGSAIKNCGLTAAFNAASQEGIIGMAQIIEALQIENDKCGLGLNLSG